VQSLQTRFTIPGVAFSSLIPPAKSRLTMWMGQYFSGAAEVQLWSCASRTGLRSFASQRGK
jgi:hypothetical protein